MGAVYRAWDERLLRPVAIKHILPDNADDPRQRERLLGYALIVPAFAFIVGLIAYPAVWAAYFSFTSKVVGQAERWVGLRNYGWILGWPDFGLMILNTIILTVFAVAIKAVVGLTMALALNEQLPLRNLVRALLFLPWTVPTFVAGLIWQESRASRAPS